MPTKKPFAHAIAIAGFFMLSILLTSGCVSVTPLSPLQKALHSQDKAETIRLLRLEPDQQAVKDKLFAESIVFMPHSANPRANFYSDFAREMHKEGANMYAHVERIVISASGSPSAIELLHDLGFDLNAKSHDGSTLIKSAVVNGAPEAVEKLAQLGVNLNSKGYLDYTPLGDAVERWATDLDEYRIYNDQVKSYYAKRAADGERNTKLLVRYGADVNGKYREDGRTPLFSAALANREDIMRYLVSHGANTKATDLAGNNLEKYWELGRQKTQSKENKRREAESSSFGSIMSGLGQIAVMTTQNYYANKATAAERASNGPTVFDMVADSDQKLAQQNAKWKADAANKQGQQTTSNTPTATYVSPSKPSSQPYASASNAPREAKNSLATASPVVVSQTSRSNETWHDEYTNTETKTGVTKSYPNHERNIPVSYIASKLKDRASAEAVWSGQGGKVIEFYGSIAGGRITVVVDFGYIKDTHVYVRDK